jgi:hypothetical protein
MPPFYKYFSLYIVIWGFLYWMNIVKYNPFSWLIIALLVSIITTNLEIIIILIIISITIILIIIVIIIGMMVIK